jgi:hypothetical protein
MHCLIVERSKIVRGNKIARSAKKFSSYFWGQRFYGMAASALLGVPNLWEWRKIAPILSHLYSIGHSSLPIANISASERSLHNRSKEPLLLLLFGDNRSRCQQPVSTITRAPYCLPDHSAYILGQISTGSGQHMANNSPDALHVCCKGMPVKTDGSCTCGQLRN